MFAQSSSPVVLPIPSAGFRGGRRDAGAVGTGCCPNPGELGPAGLGLFMGAHLYFIDLLRVCFLGRQLLLAPAPRSLGRLSGEQKAFFPCSRALLCFQLLLSSLAEGHSRAGCS